MWKSFSRAKESDPIVACRSRWRGCAGAASVPEKERCDPLCGEAASGEFRYNSLTILDIVG